MGKKSGRGGSGDKQDGAASTKAAAFVLRVPMHCRCQGCDDKIRAGVKDLTLHHGIEALDQSALWTKGDLTVVSTADPEKLRRRLHKATGKNVGLFLPKPQQAADKDAEKEAAMQELLRHALQQGGHGHGQAAAWANQALPGGWAALQPGGYGGYESPAQAYSWPVQVPQPQAYHSGYPGAATGGGVWGAYAYPPAAAAAVQGHGGAYGGGWHAHGPY